MWSSRQEFSFQHLLVAFVTILFCIFPFLSISRYGCRKRQMMNGAENIPVHDWSAPAIPRPRQNTPNRLTATLSRSSARLSRWSLESRAATPALLATQRESPTLATIRPRDRPSNRATSPVDPLASPSCSYRCRQDRWMYCADGVRATTFCRRQIW